jgi:hypothetical protein
MIPEILERKFTRIGARLKVTDRTDSGGGVRLDVRTDRRGEFFEVIRGGSPESQVEVLDVQPSDRHLLLMVREDGAKSKFLCGHDERHWFVAAVPEGAPGVSGVREAMLALQPAEVRHAVARKRPKDPFRRKNTAFVRQGEWFFVPEPNLVVDEHIVLHDEPISRGRGTPHVVQDLYRRGGEVVYVSGRYPQGLSEAAYERLPDKLRQRESWQQMVRDASVFARGAVRHPDHATIVLRGWHRVAMNTEHRAVAMRHVAFLD